VGIRQPRPGRLGHATQDRSGLICAPRSMIPEELSPAQNCGTVRFAQVEGQSRCASKRIRTPGFRSPILR
jgi:hypothetical protein